MTEPDIFLHKSDRGILIGANGTGKSTLAAATLASFREQYPNSRILVLDTKPRWRATLLADGTSPRRLYRPLAKGDTIDGAISTGHVSDWPIIWSKHTNPSQTVIAQRLDGTVSDNIRFQVQMAERFFKTQTVRRPSLLYLDEGMDFFSTSASARGGSDIVQRCFRAGRERGLATLIGVQRPVGINLQCLTETSWCALFRINYAEDVKRLYDMGWPRDAGPPSYEDEDRHGKGVFRLWRNGQRNAPKYRLGAEKVAA